MKNEVKIYKGAAKSASVCCGSEVSAALIDSCCGTQELPDDIKIAFLKSYLQEYEGQRTVDLQVNHIEGEDARDTFRKFCVEARIIDGSLEDASHMLPLVVVNNKIRFVGRIPTGDELVEEFEIS